MRKQSDILKITFYLGLLLLIVALPSDVFASTVGSYAWETTSSKIITSLTGPVAYAISIIAIFSCGFIMAFADLQMGAKRFVQAALGISVAVGAPAIITSFLGFSGAVIG